MPIFVTLYVTNEKYLITSDYLFIYLELDGRFKLDSV